MNKNSYIVDIGLTMVRNNLKTYSNKNQDKQELHCKCGEIFRFNGKVKRAIVINSQGTFQDSKSIDIIICPACNRKYPDNEKAIIISPNEGTLLSIKFFRKNYINSKNENIFYLFKERIYAYYNDNKINYASVFDHLCFNETTKQTALFIDNVNFQDVRHLSSKSVNINNKMLEKNIFQILGLTNTTFLIQFFGYSQNIEYIDLEESFQYFLSLEPYMADMDDFKKLDFLKEFYDSYKIYDGEEITSQNDKRKYKYRLIPDSYGFGSVEQVELNVGEYLEIILEISKIFCCTTNFSNITTIFLTKGWNFYNKFINGDFICNSNVYKKEKSTYPTKIIETSINYTHEGKMRITKNIKNVERLRISPILYENISENKDMKYLFDFNNLGLITKTQLESLFQKFPAENIYGAFAILCESNNTSINLNLRHIEHIIKYKLWDGYRDNAFLLEYLDTVKTAGLIVEYQGKVAEFVTKNRNHLSESELKSYENYLKTKENIIFEAKTSRQLKTMHDTLSSLYAIFQDAEEAEKYMQIVRPLSNLMNDMIDEIEFTVIPSAMELHKEHLVLGHCIQTYLKQINSGKYLAIHVQDTISNERATMGLLRDGNTFCFEQLKGYKNSRATKYMINKVKEYLSKHKISQGTFYNDLNPSPTSEIKMSDYLSAEEVEKIKKQKLLDAKKEESAK